MLLSFADLFQNNFKKNLLGNTNIESNGLHPDQDQQSVSPDLGPNGLQSLSADNKSPH